MLLCLCNKSRCTLNNGDGSSGGSERNSGYASGSDNHNIHASSMDAKDSSNEDGNPSTMMNAMLHNQVSR